MNITQRCDAFDGTLKEFRKILKQALLDAVPVHRDLRTYLANEMEVARSTVDKWTRGFARPHPLLQKQVVEKINVFFSTTPISEKR